jgi:hypothetical protein
MLHAIENNHGAASEQVQLARGGRNRTFDVAVALLFLPLYVIASIAASRRPTADHDRAGTRGCAGFCAPYADVGTRCTTFSSCIASVFDTQRRRRFALGHSPGTDAAIAKVGDRDGERAARGIIDIPDGETPPAPPLVVC